MPKKIGIIGGAGYTGGELLRILLRHPAAEIVFVQSRSQAGKPISDLQTDLFGETDLHFSKNSDAAVDVLFLCMAHGEAKNWLAEQPENPDLKIIDLSHDFRAGGSWSGHEFVYGLSEINKKQIENAHLIANPGCFATAIQLALLPLAAAGKLAETFVTGITGATGAGQNLSETSHFSWRHANVSAYKTLEHQHLAEIKMTLDRQPSVVNRPPSNIHFVPWRGDFPRGIFISCTLETDLEQKEAFDLFEKFYEKHPFTHVSRRMIDLKMAVNTNKCLVFPEKRGSHLVVHAALDNLLKGAAGQAVQNFNLIFGLDETAGLNLKASFF